MWAKTFNGELLPSRIFYGKRDADVERIAMHRIKELLRLKYECALSFERLARVLKVSKGAVAKYVKAAEVTGLDWAALRELDEEALERRLNLRHGRGAGATARGARFGRRASRTQKKWGTLALLWEEYRQAQGEAPIPRFCDPYR